MMPEVFMGFLLSLRVNFLAVNSDLTGQEVTPPPVYL